MTAGVAVIHQRRRRLLDVGGHAWRVPLLPALALIVLLALPAAAPGLLAPYSPTEPDLRNTYAPPVGLGGTWTHFLGTDSLGRDIFSRLVYGARISALVAIATIVASGALGSAAGIIAGYYAHWVDAILMRVVDVFFSLPVIMVAIAAAALFHPSVFVLSGVIVMILWAQFARLVRGDVLAIRERDYIRYARAVGIGDARIMLTHVLPNVLSSIVVLATLQVGWVILVEASLSFIGAGVPPPAPAWGSMVADGRSVIGSAWWVSFFPGLVIWAVVVSLNAVGDWLRDRLDPRLVTLAQVERRPVLGVTDTRL